MVVIKSFRCSIWGTSMHLKIYDRSDTYCIYSKICILHILKLSKQNGTDSSKRTKVKGSIMDIVPSCKYALMKTFNTHHHTLPMASVWCCVQICSLLTQCCLSLASEAVRHEQKKKKRVKSLLPLQKDKRTPHRFLSAITAVRSILSKFDGQGWVLRPDGTADELHQCWQVGGTHPWACTVPHWWHWRWRCVNPRRSGRWPPQPMGASHVVSGVATAHWRNTPAGRTHCSGQKTWNHPATIVSASLSDKNKIKIISIYKHTCTASLLPDWCIS